MATTVIHTETFTLHPKVNHETNQVEYYFDGKDGPILFASMDIEDMAEEEEN